MKARKLFTHLISVFLICSTLFGCYDDSHLEEEIEDLKKRVTNLEQLYKQLNTNILSLENIVNVLNEADFITAITPIMEGDKTIGYTINFKNNPPITIYHGVDGKDGTNGKDGIDGKDGVTPQISIQAIDGIFYWLINGEFIVDNNGNKIPVSGSNGITPQLKIENDQWLVSYDNGKTWQIIGSAIGSNSNAIFKDIIVKDFSIILVLRDGQQLEIPLYQTQIASLVPITNGSDKFFMNNLNYTTPKGIIKYYITPKEAIEEISKNWQKSLSVKAVTSTWENIKLPILDFKTNNDTIVLEISGENLSDKFYNRIIQAKVSLTVNQSKESPQSALEPIKQMNNMIYYTTNNNSVLTNNGNACTPNVISNTYSDKRGIIVYDDEITYIGHNLFNGYIPGEYGANYNHALESVSLPESLTHLGDKAFLGCSNLKKVILPSNLQSVGNDAFWFCHSLYTVYCKAFFPPTGRINFPSGAAIYVPEQTVNLYKEDPNWGKYNIFPMS